MLTLVVARYDEDVSWLSLTRANAFVVTKAQIGNTGREAASYLWFLAQHKGVLAGDYLFCQGDPYAHCFDFDTRLDWAHGRMTAEPPCRFGQRLACDWEGQPHHPGLELARFWDEAGLPAEAKPRRLEFTAGAQFLRSSEELRAVPHKDYERWLALAREFPQAPWIFERLWDYLIPSQNENESRNSGTQEQP